MVSVRLAFLLTPEVRLQTGQYVSGRSTGSSGNRGPSMALVKVCRKAPMCDTVQEIGIPSKKVGGG